MRQHRIPGKLKTLLVAAISSLILLTAAAPALAVDRAESETIGAKIIEIEGVAEVSAPGRQMRSLAQGDVIKVGEEVSVPRGGTLILAMADRTLRKFTGPTTLTIGPDQRKGEGKVIADLSAAVANMLFGDGQKGGEAVMATRHVETGGEASTTVPVLIRPAPGESLLEAPREFKWKSIQGVPLYRISVYSSSELMWQGTMSETRAMCPGRDCEFRPGQTYYWVVEALVGNTTLRSQAADFTLIDGEGRAELANALAEADQSVTDPRMATLLKTRLCLDCGLYAEALRIVDSHLERSPERFAYLLRAEINETMGLEETAIADYRNAMALPAAE